MDAIVLAGDAAPGERGPKALWPILGRAMVEYVVEALTEVPEIGQTVVVGYVPDGVPGERVVYLARSGSVMDLLRAGLDALGRPAEEHLLIAACDVPLLTGEMIADFLERCRPWEEDLYYPIVRREDCERQYPGMRRTYVKLRNGSFTGGNLFLAKNGALGDILAVAERFVQHRKHPFRLSRELGWSFAARLAVSRLMGVLSIDQVEDRVAEKFAVRARAVVCPHAAIGADVDRFEDLDWASRVLVRRLS